MPTARRLQANSALMAMAQAHEPLHLTAMSGTAEPCRINSPRRESQVGGDWVHHLASFIVGRHLL